MTVILNSEMLREKREEKGLTQELLAKCSNISDHCVRYLRCISPDTLAQELQGYIESSIIIRQRPQFLPTIFQQTA